MTVRPIRLLGDPVLRVRAEEVVDFDKELRILVKDLVDTMIDEDGAGLAAPQLGVSLRVFTYRCDDGTGHLVNPTFEVVGTEQQDGPEGCLSIPGLSWDCSRYEQVIAGGCDLHGDPVEVTGTDGLARVVQHETDHLDGVLFIDRLDPETRKQAMGEIRRARWFDEPEPVIKTSPHPLFGRAR